MYGSQRWGAGINVDYQDRLDRMYAAEDARHAAERFEELPSKAELDRKGQECIDVLIDAADTLHEAISGENIAEYERECREWKRDCAD